MSSSGAVIGASLLSDGEPITSFFLTFLFSCSDSFPSHSRYLQASNHLLAGLITLTFSVCMARVSCLVLSLDVLLILLPMCRNILRVVRPKVRWLPLDESVWFHRQVAYALLMFTIVHVCAHYVK